MSSQSRQSTGVNSRTLWCTFCVSPLTEKLLALQSYPSEGTSHPASFPDCGGLTVCPTCASEVVELLTCWESHEQPPVDEGDCIGDGYQETVSTCSFCTGSNVESALGIELYRSVDDELPTYANYTLCEHCQSVFDEFMQTVRRESEQ